MAVDRTFAGVNRDRPSGAKAARDSRSGMLRPVFRAAVREDLSAAGVALATAADADTQRTLLGLGTAAVEDSDAFEAAGGGGGASATEIEIDLGATAVWTGRFTITDAAISATSKVLCWQSPGPYTGKGTRADEAEMQPVQVISVTPATGSAVVRWQTPPMVAMRQEPMAGGQPANAIIPGLKDPQGIVRVLPRRMGKARGNVKFSYVVFS